MLSYINSLIYRPLGILKTYQKTCARKHTSSGKHRIFLLNIPSHGNLGDHLLSVVEQKFFKDRFSEYELVLITSADLYYSIRVALMDVHEDDVLCVTGGGFMGSMYDEEERFLTIIKRFSKNKIIFLPQTIYYENTYQGEKLIENASKYYSSHDHLYVMARDKNSYNLLINRLMPKKNNHCFIVPDMALYAHFNIQSERSGVLWCMRNDKEQNSNNKNIVKALKTELEDTNIVQYHTDTQVEYSVSVQMEDDEVNKKLIEFSKARLVITNRLHGMIYALITNTPVIAMDNLSGKIGQVYDLWLKDIHFVNFINNTIGIKDIVNDMLNKSNCVYDNSNIIKFYQPIIDAINEKI